MKHCFSCLAAISLAIAIIATACASSAPIPTILPFTPAPTIVPVSAAPLDEKVDVGGYALRILCIGQGTPTVIVEAGLGESPLESGNWTTVKDVIDDAVRICIYDRAGLGSSDVAPGESRTSQDMAQDLHTLLINANVPGPYILVGHSIGGYHILVYAGQYPREVVGMVLVDSSHPDQWTKIPAVLPPESADEPGILTQLRTIPPTSFPEKMDILASAAQVRAIASLGDLPLVVLSHSPSGNTFPRLPPQLAEKVELVWQDLQGDLAGLSSNSTHVTASEAGHFIQLDEPQLVIDAIFKVMAEAKNRGQ